MYKVFVTEVRGDVLAFWLAAPEDRWNDFQAAARSLLTTVQVMP